MTAPELPHAAIRYSDDYDTEQRAVIGRALNTKSIGSKPVVHEVSSSLHTSGTGHQYAIFSAAGYELVSETVADDDGLAAMIYVPVVIEGASYVQVIDGSYSGVLHLVKILRDRGQPIRSPRWVATWLPTAQLARVERATSIEGSQL